ncbi:extracellular solute-binding protein [Bauldia sp.]|uniref:extracellular solute-binding protein n=1 Tax=Bauldia sp. TaxID=2575872 RepID=UPI003BACB1DC
MTARSQFSDTVALLERLERLTTECFVESEPDAFMNMALFLIGRHLKGMLVTPTSLARAARIPYTTATRRVKAMRDGGYLVFRPRTPTGRTYSVHPSAKLIAHMLDYATRAEAILAHAPTPLSGSADQRRARIIPPPATAGETLGAGRGLDILLPRDPAYAVSKGLKRELSYLMGGRVRFHDATIEGLRREGLRNAQRKRSKYDIIAVDLPLVGEFVAVDALLPLDAMEGEDTITRDDFYSAAWRSTLVNTVQYAVPILINPEILFFRKDVLERAGIAPPTTTAELLAAGRALHAPSRGFYGVSWTGGESGPVGQAFIQFLADFGQPVLNLERAIDGFKTANVAVAGLKPMIDTPRGHATARFMQALLKVSPPDVLDLSWGDQVGMLREGRVAMAYEWASRASQLHRAKQVRDLGFLPHPVGVTGHDGRRRKTLAPIGGFALGIPANVAPAQVQTAWRAIEWLASAEVIKALVRQGGYVTPRFSVAADPEVRRLSPMIAAVDEMAKAGQVRLWPRPPVAQFSAIVAIVGEEIHAMLRGDKTRPTALADAQRRVADAMNETLTIASKPSRICSG